jgi:hypothetical protein
MLIKKSIVMDCSHHFCNGNIGYPTGHKQDYQVHHFKFCENFLIRTLNRDKYVTYKDVGYRSEQQKIIDHLRQNRNTFNINLQYFGKITSTIKYRMGNMILRSIGPYFIGLNQFIDLLPQLDTMVEVGSHIGESAVLFARKAQKVYCVDCWDSVITAQRGGPVFPSDSESSFDKSTSKIDNIIKMKGMGIEMIKNFKDASLDLVYIDANSHDYELVKSHILCWLPKIKKGGIVSGHDYDLIGTIRAVREILGYPDNVFQDTTWSKNV